MDNIGSLAFAIIFPIVSLAALYVCYIKPGYAADHDTPGRTND